MSRMTRRSALKSAAMAGLAITGIPLVVDDGANPGDGSQDVGDSPRTVIRGLLSQAKGAIGCHWLRCSFDTKHLDIVESFLSEIWGASNSDSFGLWSYTDRFSWPNGASINYDSDSERSERVHNNRATLDCPGQALDELYAIDQITVMEFIYAVGGTCSRIDIYFDDYRRIIVPKDLHDVIKAGNYSGFRETQFRQQFDRGRLSYDLVSFGRRGKNGSGKYLRIYDKFIESKGMQNCCRWEMEFSQDAANQVFAKLAQCHGNVDAYITICGSLIAGNIRFVRRTGDKNLSRCDNYVWWDEICKILGGSISVTIPKRDESIPEKMEWIERQVSPSLACLHKVFKSNCEFFDWLCDILDDADSRWNNHTRDLVKRHRASYEYDKEKREIRAIKGVPYVRQMSKLRC